MGSPGADGNTLSAQMPALEEVDQKTVLAVEDELIFPSIEGKRDWAELFLSTFQEEMPYDVLHHKRMVEFSLKKMDEGRLPACIMEEYRENQRFNALAAFK